MTKSIFSLLGNNWTEVRDLMKGALDSDVGLLSRINASLLDNSGKMMRPVMALLMAGVCGEVNHDTCRFAAAAELLHNATLLHDDVADRSNIRRGQPTVNATLGSGAAVLVGDFWLARAVELVLSSQRRDKVMLLFSKTLTDLAEGEMLQLEKAESCDTTEADYFRIIYCKTASLFEASLISAAESVDAPPAYRSAVADFAKAVGMAFQIKDDILDYAGDCHLGKPLGIDLKEKKITMPLLCSLRGSEREAEIRGALASIGERPENDMMIREFVAERDGVGQAAVELGKYIDKAIDALQVLPQSRERECLAELAKYNAFRDL